MWSHALLLLAIATPDSEAPVAEAPVISADRPGFSYTAGVVPAGLLQVELGVGASVGDAVQLSVPSAAVRLGLWDGVEVQLALPSATIGDGPDGLGNLGLGAKVGRSLSDALALSVVGLVYVPIGDPEVAEQTVQGRLVANLEVYFLDDGWVSANTQLDTFTDAGGDRALAVTPSLAFGWTLAEAFNPFVQSYVRFADGEVYPAVGAGLAWLATRQVQLDVSADYDLDAEAASFGAGVSWLFW